MRRAGGRLDPIAFTAVLLLAISAQAHGAGLDASPSLERDIAPILKAHCLKCHGPNKPKGKLNLGSPRAMARGGRERTDCRPRPAR